MITCIAEAGCSANMLSQPQHVCMCKLLLTLCFGFAVAGVKAVSIECNLKCKDVSEGTNESLLHPPYAISNAKSMLPLSVRTLPTTASHSDGYLEYDVHNLYGLAESRIMSKTLETVLGRRSFALTR